MTETCKFQSSRQVIGDADMEQLRLWLITSEDTAFSQYIPGNFRLLLGQDNVVCVGALYGTAACGAGLWRGTAGHPERD